uniref:Uncharacterized protein n=1 Tax=Streptomyces sp. NBC_00003 TaxID=2903608 RepID=A0AAU2UX09_9ACTN
MPASVRAAQITIWVMMGLCLLMSIALSIADTPRVGGANFSQNLMGCVLFVLAFRYGTAGKGVRTASIILASVQIMMALGGTARGIPGGVFALVGAIVVVVLLSQRTAGEWFRRPRSPHAAAEFARY